MMSVGVTDLVFRRERSVIVIENVPALVCVQCGESSVESKIAQIAFDMAQKEIAKGVSLEFCNFKVA